jgi:uncharacterized protein YacL
MAKKTTKKPNKKVVTPPDQRSAIPGVDLPAKLVTAIADEVAKTVVSTLPRMIPRRNAAPRKPKLTENALFLDTSAIIDGRIFDVMMLGLITGTVVIPEPILLELKHIADSQDMVKRERGRKGLALLDRVKKSKAVKVVVLPEKSTSNSAQLEVDEKLIATARSNRGRVVTCDYNLEKKASISGVRAINVHTLAHALKVRAVPGEALHIKVLHKGKDQTQGVGYLDDGTMLVVENASELIGHEIDVIVSRVIQTTAGRILFSKRI